MRYTSEFIEVNGTRLHYLLWEGDRKRSYFIQHGNSHCGGVYAPLAEELAKDGSSVIALDLRGHGLSDRPEGGYEWPSLRNDAIAIIEKLGLENVILLGHSRGGGVSLLSASIMGDRVAGVVVYEPTLPMLARAGRTPYLTTTVVETRREQALRRRATFADRDDVFKHYRNRESFAGWREDYLRAFCDHGIVESEGGGVELACPPWVQARLYEVTFDAGTWDYAGRDDLPLTAVYGDRSGRMAEDGEPGNTLRRMYPLSDIIVMNDATHSGPMEHPEEFEAIIGEMAARVRKP